MSQANGPAAAFCAACRRYWAPRAGRRPAFCIRCGGPTVAPGRDQVEEDRARRSYLLDELAKWASGGALDGEMTARLAAPYAADLRAIAGGVE
jgi:hypothetical protein